MSERTLSDLSLRHRPLLRPGEPAQEPSWRSPVRSTYGQVTGLARRSRRILAHRPGVSILQGDRKFGYPLLAATAYRELGICRHVLNQMVVAGTHMVPFGSGISILETFRPEAPLRSQTPPGLGDPTLARQGRVQPGMQPPLQTAMTSTSSTSEAPLSWDWDPLMLMAEPD